PLPRHSSGGNPVKKLLALAAAVAPAIALLPAQAMATNNVCVPVTVNGQPVACVDIQPVDDAITTAAGLAAGALDLAERDAESVPFGVQHCDQISSHDGETDLYLATGGSPNPYGYECARVKVVVT